MLSLGAQHGTLRLAPDGDATWQVIQLRREVKPTCVAEGLPLAYAQGLGEDMAASWRSSASQMSRRPGALNPRARSRRPCYTTQK